MKRIQLCIYLLACTVLCGCSIFAFGGAVKQSFEDQKLVETHPQYSLDDQRVAVVITANLSVHY